MGVRVKSRCFAVVMFAAFLAVALAGLCGCNVLGASSGGQSGLSASSGSSSTQESTVSSSSSGEVSSAQSFEPPSSTQAARTLSLDNPDDRARVNSFVSDFAKVWGKDYGYDGRSATTEDRLAFATALCEIDHLDNVEHKPSYGLYEVEGNGGTPALEGYRMRVDAKLVSDIVQQHFGGAVDFSEVSAPQLHPYQYQDGYVYFGGAEGHAVKALAFASSMEARGDGEYSVSANVYDVKTTEYDASNTSYYSQSIEDFESGSLPSGTFSFGTMVIKDDGKNLRLVSYYVGSDSTRIELRADAMEQRSTLSATDGFYSAVLLVSGRNPNHDEAAVTNARVDGENLLLHGVMRHADELEGLNANHPAYTLTTSHDWAIPVSSGAVFTRSGGVNGPVEIPKEEFAGYLTTIDLANLRIEVRNGAVVSAFIGT